MAPARYGARGLGGPSLPASTRVLLGARAVGGPRGTDCPASGRASFLQGLRKSSLDLRKSSRGWNTAASMTPMFKKAGVFDRDISSWNTSTLTTCPSCSRTPAPSTRTSPVGLERDGRNKQREHVGWSDCHDGGTQASRGSRAKRPEEAGPSVQRKPWRTRPQVLEPTALRPGGNALAFSEHCNPTSNHEDHASQGRWPSRCTGPQPKSADIFCLQLMCFSK